LSFQCPVQQPPTALLRTAVLRTSRSGRRSSPRPPPRRPLGNSAAPWRVAYSIAPPPDALAGVTHPAGAASRSAYRRDVEPACDDGPLSGRLQTTGSRPADGSSESVRRPPRTHLRATVGPVYRMSSIIGTSAPPLWVTRTPLGRNRPERSGSRGCPSFLLLHAAEAKGCSVLSLATAFDSQNASALASALYHQRVHLPHTISAGGKPDSVHGLHPNTQS